MSEIKEDDHVRHPKYNEGKPTFVRQLSADGAQAEIEDHNTFVWVPVAELSRITKTS